MPKILPLSLLIMLCMAMVACGGREVDVSAKGQIIVGGGVGGGLAK